MCQLKSAIMLKDRVLLLPNEESHTAILEHFKIPDISLGPAFVRVELLPPNRDVFAPIDDWKLNVDQDFKPDWFFEESEKPRLVVAVKEWAAEHIHMGKNNLRLSEGIHYVKDCKDIILYDSSTVSKMYGSSTVSEMYGSSTVSEMYDSSTVSKMYGSSTVSEMYGSSTAIAHAWHNTGKTDALILSDNSTFKDGRTKTIYQSGAWSLVLADR